MRAQARFKIWTQLHQGEIERMEVTIMLSMRRILFFMRQYNKQLKEEVGNTSSSFSISNYSHRLTVAPSGWLTAARRGVANPGGFG